MVDDESSKANQYVIFHFEDSTLNSVPGISKFHLQWFVNLIEILYFRSWLQQ